MGGLAPGRTWEWLAVELHEGFDSLEDIKGLVGEEVGQKFYAFLQVNVDIDELMDNPDMWDLLNIDGKYMAATMLGSWFSKHASKPERAFGLVDKMCKDSREYLIVSLVSTSSSQLVKVLQNLLKHRKEYFEMLREIVLKLKPALRGQI